MFVSIPETTLETYLFVKVVAHMVDVSGSTLPRIGALEVRYANRYTLTVTKLEGVFLVIIKDNDYVSYTYIALIFRFSVVRRSGALRE